MNRSSSLKSFVCRLLIGLVLFSNAAVVAYACSGTSIGAAADVSIVQADGPGCDHLDGQSPNLCVEHCRPAQQSSDTSRVVLAMAMAPVPLYGRLAAWQSASHAQAMARWSGVARPPPSEPHAVVHCVLRL